MFWKKCLRFFFLMGFLSFSSTIALVSVAAEAAKPDETHLLDGRQKKKSPALSEVIPSAISLDEQYADLKKRIKGISDLSSTQKKLVHILDKVNDISKQWLTLKSSEGTGYDQLRDMRLALEEEMYSLNEVGKSLTEKIEAVDVWRKVWTEENGKWTEWQIALEKGGALGLVKTTFTKARQTITEALNLASQELHPLLSSQQKVGQTQSRIHSLGIEMDSFLQEAPPSFFSSSYFLQITGKGLWHKILMAFSSVSWPDAEFFARHGWIIISQLLLALIFAIGIFRRRISLKKSEKWHFLATRPFSAGIFIGIMSFLPFYSQKPPPWVLVLAVLAAIAFSRLIGGVVHDERKRRLIYCLAAIFVLTRFLIMINLPLPLFRLYVFFVALIGLSFCLWEGLARQRNGDLLLYIWALRLGAMAFLVILIAEAGGYSSFALRLFESILGTVFLLLVYLMLLLLAKGAVELTVNNVTVQKVPVIHKNASGIILKSGRILNFLLGFFLVAVILSSWGVYGSPAEAMKGLLSLGFTAGSFHISVGLIISAAALLYGSFLASWSIQALLMDEVLPRRQVDKGIQISIARLVHYALVFLGFMLALMALGLELTNLTILGGAVGIGVGFGLQAIVNNFASGLILLFERPVKVGDTIELADQWGEIKKLGLRATIVQTYDNAEIVVPNSDLITNQVTNWTLAERRVRLKIPVGVAYGSDVTLVMKILMDCAEEHSLVLKEPATQVLFMAFGASSLDFELRAWISDFNYRIKVQSELLQEIDQRFRQSNIEIPFPQRDLHVRSMDEAVASSLKSPYSEE